MKRTTILILTLLATLALVTGCGGEQAEEQAAPTNNAAPESPAQTESATVATHDCAGGCGMKDVPEKDMTEVHGEWYCAGCAKKANEDHGHDHG